MKSFGFRVAKLLLLIGVISMLVGCTFTTMTPNYPQFTVQPASISADIGSLIPTEHVKLAGSKVKTNGQTTSELAITVINAVNPPKDGDQYEKLAEEIAQVLKHALKDPNQYDTYKVIFFFDGTKAVHGESISTEFFFSFK